MNFLAKLHSEGYKYQSLNAYCSAILSTHEYVDGISVGSHPTVSQLLQGALTLDHHNKDMIPSGMLGWQYSTSKV